MANTFGDLLISLASLWRSHLEELNELKKPENLYCFRESVLLRQSVADTLADEPAVPTVMEIIELSYEIEAAGLGQVDLVRAALSRWGSPAPQPPADGEVAELVEGLHLISDGMSAIGHDSDSWFVARAAELLQQQQAKIESLEQQLETERMRLAVCGVIAMSDTPFSAAKNRNYHPDYWSASADDIARQIDELMRLRAQQTLVPVSERLPGPEDCDAAGRCWFLRFPFDYSRESWSLEDRTYGCNTGFTHWLPAHALPLPGQEAER